MALEPDFANARNEIGVILSNMRRHPEAEAAFAEAEPYHGEHGHHWYARGCNYIALGDLERAESALRRSVKLAPQELQVPAMSRLAAVLLKRGTKAGEAGRLCDKVHHLMGEDPREHVDQLLDVWRDCD